MPTEPSAQAPLRFEEITDPDYPAAFIALGIEDEKLPGGGLILYGRCPRCQGGIEVPLPTGTVREAADTSAVPGTASLRRAPLAPVPVTEPEPIAIVCTCTECEHPGRPAGIRDGCGAYWLLTVVQGDM